MRRFTMLTICLLLLACFAVTTAWAASPHYKRGSPSCSDKGLFEECTATISGLGNFDVVVSLTENGTGTTQCTNPGNGNVVPGQNPAIPVTPSGILALPAADIKNGNLTFTIDTVVPTVTSAQAGCPNGNWTASFTDISFTAGGGTLTVSQCIGGTVDLTTGACSGSLTQVLQTSF